MKKYIKKTKCCDAYSTYHEDGTLCCKVCWNEVEIGEGDGSEYEEVEESKTTKSYNKLIDESLLDEILDYKISYNVQGVTREIYIGGKNNMEHFINESIPFFDGFESAKVYALVPTRSQDLQSDEEWIIYMDIEAIPQEPTDMIKGLLDIQECMGSGLFQLDSETEDEMMEQGCISMYTEDMQEQLDEAIKLLKLIQKLGGK